MLKAKPESRNHKRLEVTVVIRSFCQDKNPQILCENTTEGVSDTGERSDKSIRRIYQPIYPGIASTHLSVGPHVDPGPVAAAAPDHLVQNALVGEPPPDDISDKSGDRKH